MLCVMADNSVTRLMETRREAIEKRMRLDEDISAIDRVLEILGVNIRELQTSEAEIDQTLESLPTPQDSVSSPAHEGNMASSQNGRTEKIRITQEIRNAVQGFEGEFTQQDIVEWIKSKHPFAEVRSPTVSSALWRMANKGTIEKIREGYGSEPNTYRKVSHDSPTQEGFPNGEDTVNEKDLMSE